MKILLVTESYWPNYDGGALFERRLVQALNAESHPTEVWAPGYRLRSYTEYDGNYKIYREKAITSPFNTNYKLSYFPFLRGRRIIKSVRPDVIHIHNGSGMGLAALLWAKYYKIPLVITNHFMPENATLNIQWLRPLARLLNGLGWRYLVWFHNRADFVTSPTESAVNMLLEHGLAAPSRAITNGVDAELFRPEPADPKIREKYGISADKRVLLYLGRLDGEKRLDILLLAFANVAASHADIELVIAGKGKEADNLAAQAAHLGISSQVTFTGFVDEADKAGMYHNADGFIISSPAELQSIVTLEAMACGLPVIAVDIGALAELCRSEHNGYLAKGLDADELGNLIHRLFADEDRRARFGRNSRELIEERHRHQLMVAAYLDTYKEAADAHRHIH